MLVSSRHSCTAGTHLADQAVTDRTLPKRHTRCSFRLKWSRCHTWRGVPALAYSAPPLLLCASAAPAHAAVRLSAAAGLSQAAPLLARSAPPGCKARAVVAYWLPTQRHAPGLSWQHCCWQQNCCLSCIGQYSAARGGTWVQLVRLCAHKGERSRHTLRLSGAEQRRSLGAAALFP